MSKSSRRTDVNRESIDSDQSYSLDEAISLLKKTSNAKFNETIDIAINLGIDSKKSDQNVRGSMVLPNGTGKTLKVIVFEQSEQVEAAKNAGADHTILYTETDFLTEVKNITNGQGVQVAYDSVGLTTYEKSLASLAPRGYLVLFGQSSGVVPPISPLILNKGSNFLTRPALGHYLKDREELDWRTGDLFEWIKTDRLNIRIHEKIALKNARRAHEDLESRRTSGKLLLIP